MALFDDNKPLFTSDWLSRVTIPDMYPRRSDPYRPGAAIIPGQAPTTLPQAPAADVYQNITIPGQRPFVYQRFVNFQITANVTPVPLTPNRFECDTIVVGVASTAANSVFVGNGSAITTASGIEARPGSPLVFIPENSREQWELQRALEVMATIIARQNGLPDPGPYRAPRVVFDASDFFAVATAATTVAVMLFYVPEQQ